MRFNQEFESIRSLQISQRSLNGTDIVMNSMINILTISGITE